MMAPSQFRFLNTNGFCRTASDWNDPGRGKLWLYNLHYFDDLSARGAAERAPWHADLIRRWIQENPPGRGIGWDPYPTSLRIVNWIKWAGTGGPVPPGFHESLAIQVRWLSARLEHHLLANHLLANAKALVTAGLHFAGDEADRWRDEGLRLLAREIPAQVLRDGGHCERSPMYHDIVLEDVLDLLNATRAHPGVVPDATRNRWANAANLMRAWSAAMSHPDGRISFFNDSAFDVAATGRELNAYAGRLGLGDMVPGALGESGYLRAERGRAALIADVAEVGPDYQPAHAHADTLSFELSLGAHRVLVNTGTSTYEPGPQRALERSTRAHNTLEVDETDSSEVWSVFRVARRARPLSRRMVTDGGATILQGSHDGYRRLSESPVHHREWRLEDTRLLITDRVVGSFRKAVARFHFHPEVKAAEGAKLRAPDGTELSWSVTGGDARLVKTRWHPEFGRAEPNLCLEVVLRGAELVVELRW